MALNNDDLLFFTFRYALGRHSYIVGTVVEALIERWDALEERTKLQILKEIKESIERGEAGWDMDVSEWEKVLKLKI